MGLEVRGPTLSKKKWARIGFRSFFLAIFGNFFENQIFETQSFLDWASMMQAYPPVMQSWVTRVSNLKSRFVGLPPQWCKTGFRRFDHKKIGCPEVGGFCKKIGFRRCGAYPLEKKKLGYAGQCFRIEAFGLTPPEMQTWVSNFWVSWDEVGGF